MIAALAIVWALAGCAAPAVTFDASRPDTGPPDAPEIDGGTAMGLMIPWLERGEPEIAAPAIPWLERGDPDVAPPVLTPCPVGWRALPASGVLPGRCDPWPEAGRATCTAIDEAHLPGAPGCEPVGRACPTGTWPVDLAGVVRYVDDDAPVGGDGTEARPYRTIGAALATPGAETIALARGTYREALAIDAPVAIRGACAAETTITTDAADEELGVIEVSAPDVILEDVRIADAARMGVVVRAGGAATMRGIVVERVVARGVLVDGAASGSIERAIVRHVARRADGSRGRGIVVSGGASATIRRVAVSDVYDAAVYVIDATATLEDAVIASVRDVGETSDGFTWYSGGIQATGSAVVSVRRVALEDVEGHGALCQRGSRLEIEDLVAARVVPAPDDGFGNALATAGTLIVRRALLRDLAGVGVSAVGEMGSAEVQDLVVAGAHAGASAADPGATLSLERAVLAGGREHGIAAYRGAATVTRDVSIEGPGSADAGYGSGIYAVSGSQVTAARVAIARVRTNGVAAFGSALDLVDVVIRDASGSARGLAGVGIGAYEDEAGRRSVRLERVLVERVRSGGLDVGGASALDARDLVIRDVAPRAYDLEAGYGIAARDVPGSIERASITRCRDGAIYAGRGSRLLVSDLAVADVEAEEATGKYGRGIESAGDLELVRARIERVADIGIFALGALDDGTPLVLRDVVVRHVRSRALDAAGGRGLYLADRARLERVLVERVRDSGIAVIGAADLLDVVVRDVAPQECAASRCAAAGGGRGIAVFSAGTASVARFRIERSALVGVQIAGGGSIDLFDGVVAENPIGVNVQVEGFDVRRLAPFVLYEANGSTIDYRSLAIPSSSDPGS